MSILIHPTYFPNIAQMAAAVQADELIFEGDDNYQKQTYRNRAYIATSMGRLQLSVPIKHNKGIRQKYCDLQVDETFPWQSQHWKSLQTAYRTSPYFEFYEDELVPLFKRPVTHLMEHNLAVFDLLCELLQAEIPYSLTEEYFKDPEQKDLRFLAEVKQPKNFLPTAYNQVFGEKHGYLPNLSILDLLFNEGPNALYYLESEKLAFIP